MAAVAALGSAAPDEKIPETEITRKGRTHWRKAHSGYPNRSWQRNSPGRRQRDRSRRKPGGGSAQCRWETGSSYAGKPAYPTCPENRWPSSCWKTSCTSTHPGEHRERLADVRKTLEHARLHAHMVRLDCCASIEIKYRLSQGEPEWRPEFGDIILDDPRAFEILMDYPRPTVPVWRRPWADAMALDGYPVEYRAFVRDGKLQGISNYYPQRPLVEFPEHIQSVREMTQALTEAVRTPFQWHLVPMREDLDPAGVHFTADFIALSGEVVFLEGGPPHEMGAHPCCFLGGEIDGVALESRK